MLVTGLILGGLSLLGFWLTYTRLPRVCKEWVKSHPFLTDVACTYATYEILKGTVTALVAAGVVSTGLSLLLFCSTGLRALWRRLRRRPAEAPGHAG